MTLTTNGRPSDPFINIYLDRIDDYNVMIKANTGDAEWYLLTLKVKDGQLYFRKVADITDPLVATDDYGQILEIPNA